MTLLKVDNLSLAIAGTAILHSVSFSMRRGEIRSIIGPNGAGKSSLVRCLAGVAGGWTGSVCIDGRDLGTVKARERAALVCYLPQTVGDPPAFTVREYVKLGRYAHSNLSRGDAREGAVEEALALTGMEDFAERELPTLSGGERQLAGIAAAVAQEARILVLDEPASFLDPLRQAGLQRLISHLNTVKGITFLVVTHDLNAAISFSRTILALRGGRVIYDGSAPEIADAAILESVYGMAFSLIDAGGGKRVVLPAAQSEEGAWI